MFRRISILIYLYQTALRFCSATELPSDDPRFDWQCAYPYTETTCQSVLLAWARDHDTPWETIFTGTDCSGCEPHYEQDESLQWHLAYAECKHRMGARFTSSELISPIIRYRKADEDTPGWSITEWTFKHCFQTWKCSRYCSLTQYPPKCIKYRSTNWGLYQPNVSTRCDEVRTEGVSPNTYPSIRKEENKPRDNNWTPVH